MKKRTLATLLLFAMLLSASCGGSGSSTDTTAGDTSASDTTTAENANPEPNLPYTQYNGDDFTFFIRNPNGASYKELYIYAESEIGEVVNDAIYDRNTQVEEKFDINIKMLPYMSDDWGIAKELSNYVLADDNSIDVVSYMGSSLMKNALNGELVDFNTLDHADFTQAYWDSSALEQFKVGGKSYLMTGDISMSSFASAYSTYFNERLIEENHLENPYDLVASNEWTIDKYAEMIKAVARDVDGVNGMDTNDIYGLIFTESGANSAFAHAAAAGGVSYLNRDSDGVLTLAPLSEKLTNIGDILESVLKTDAYAISNQRLKQIGDTSGFANEYDYGRGLFANGQSLFIQYGLSIINQFSNMEDDFGIVPCPKYDSEQDRYYATVDEYANMLAIPITASDLDQIGQVLEYMSWLSQDTLVPAYYDVNLKGKKIRGDRAIEMLDLIKASRNYNVPAVLGINVVGKLVEGFNNGNIASTYDANKSSFEKQLEQIMENLE